MDKSPDTEVNAAEITRRQFLRTTAIGAGAGLLSLYSIVGGQDADAVAAGASSTAIIDAEQRFPYFQSKPVSYLHVKMQDAFWAPRQRSIHEVTVPWATRHWDKAGGLAAFKENPATYQARTHPGDMEAIKFIEAMAAVVGLERDRDIEGLIDSWGKVWIEGQGAEGYLQSGFASGTVSHFDHPWQAHRDSHETYLIGHYLEAAIAYRESTGSVVLYDSAVRAVDNMVTALLDSQRPYLSGHPEIEHALMRLYEYTGNTEYLHLTAWFIAQRGHHAGRVNAGKYAQDHIPVKYQRTIEGHAVSAAFLFNGVTEYVGATGDAGYRTAVLSIWDDFVGHKMYLHGAGGQVSTKNEGYRSEPYVIPPDDTYGESCSVFGNFQWAHSLFRLTGDARYLDTAERMLYNAFYASLSLRGDRFFYRNVSQIYDPTLRYDWHAVPCCPPNIAKLFCKVGGFFYSTDEDGIFVKHYGASEADISFGQGVKLIQSTGYPWEGDVAIRVECKEPTMFSLRLRMPAWAKSHSLSVNGEALITGVQKGWLSIHRSWQAGDTVRLNLPMSIARVTMPPQFKDYKNLVALERGPIVYCVEQQDAETALEWLYLPEDVQLTAEHRKNLLGGVTVLKGNLPQANFMYVDETVVPVTFVPYGVWNNREPGSMTIWLSTQARSLQWVDEFLK